MPAWFSRPTVAPEPAPGTFWYWKVIAPLASSNSTSKLTRFEVSATSGTLSHTTAKVRLPVVPVVAVVTVAFLSSTRSSQNGATTPLGW
ncbi:hypothetical protein GCM10025734_04700 [Kitasatospora paranensis]